MKEILQMYIDEKRNFVKNEISILTFITIQKPPDEKPEDNSRNSQKIRVQRLSAPVFSGTFKEYASFKQNYQAIMENSGYNKIHLAYQLKKGSLPNEAKAIVKNEIEYDEIGERLDEKYGDIGELISIVLKDISQLKVVEDEDDKTMITLADKIEEGYQDLKCIGKEAQLANIVTLKTIEAKLPKRVLREWWKQSEKYEKNLDVDSDISFLSGERAKASH